MMIIETVLNRLISIQKTKEGKQQLKKFYASHKPIMIITLTEIMKETSNQYNQKIKELENDIERLKQDAIDYFRVTTNKLEDKDEIIIQLKSKLNNQTEKIKELIKHFDFLGSGGDNYAKHVVKRLKSLLGEKE